MASPADALPIEWVHSTLCPHPLAACVCWPHPAAIVAHPDGTASACVTVPCDPNDSVEAQRLKILRTIAQRFASLLATLDRCSAGYEYLATIHRTVAARIADPSNQERVATLRQFIEFE